MRLFKVYDYNRDNEGYQGPYACPESQFELCVARNPRQAAEITQGAWQARGHECEEFDVIELRLPENIGLICEPNTLGVYVNLRLLPGDKGQTYRPKTPA